MKTMRYWITALALAGWAAQALADDATQTAIKAALTPPFSEERNATVAFVGTQNFYIGRMATVCRPILGESEAFPKETVAKWQARGNGPYFNLTVRYMQRLVESIKDTSASAMLLLELRQEVQRNGQAAVDAALGKADTDQAAACKAFLGNLDAGKFDIRSGVPHFDTLREMAGDFGGL